MSGYLLLSLFSMFLISTADIPKRIGVLLFNEDGILFVADPIASTIYAYSDTSDQSGAEASVVSYNIDEVDSIIAAKLGTTRDKIFIRDMASHPSTKEAYLGVEMVQDETYIPTIVIMNPSGQARIFNLSSVSTSFKCDDAPTEDYKFWERTPMRTLTFTNMEFFQGKLYVAGISNADFKSTLRIIDYPFSGKADGASVEIYHANHDQNETRAPIMTMKILPVNGKNYVLASYTCTPLVIFPLDQLKNGAHITGKTIAELGYGNTPIDMLSYMAQDFQQNKFPVVMLSNRDQSSMVIKMSDIEAAMQKPGLSTFAAFKNAGVPVQNVPIAGMLQVTDLDAGHILALRREAVSGTLSLLTYQKNLYFRLSDFISEFEFPSYQRNMNIPTAAMVKGIQDMMKEDEGFQK